MYPVVKYLLKVKNKGTKSLVKNTVLVSPVLTLNKDLPIGDLTKYFILRNTIKLFQLSVCTVYRKLSFDLKLL